jgi:hypothetical protein
MKKAIAIIFVSLLLSGCYNWTTVDLDYSGGDGVVVKKFDDKIFLGFKGKKQIYKDDKTGQINHSYTFYVGNRSLDAQSGPNKKITTEHCLSKGQFVHFYGDFTETDEFNINSSAIFFCSEKNLTSSPISDNYRVFTSFDKDSLIYKKGVTKEAKSICKELGFKVGTDSFANCTLQLYQAKINPPKTTISSGSSVYSGSSSVTIYDPVRDNNAQIKRGMGLITGKCTLGDLSNC